MDENINNRVWQVPVSEPNYSDPSSTLASSNDQNSKSFPHLKTSLEGNNCMGQDLRNKLKQYNRDVLTTSQSFNNSPKPFKRATSSALGSLTNSKDVTSSTNKTLFNISRASIVSSTSNNYQNQSSVEETNSTSTSGKINNQKQLPVKFVSQLSQVAELSDASSGSDNNNSNNTNTNTNTSRLEQNQKQKQEENMAPKLVHNPYNSPIDLYSMNNIRKTIEAHTELIAPGLKGINFMKPETPVNKQSEVYKLVMEEERASHQRQQASGSGSGQSRLSPISGQPTSTRQTSFMAQNENQSYLAGQAQQEQRQQAATTMQASSSSSASNSQLIASVRGQQAPNCCECGQTIVGAFARIGQNRCVHPYCFNCTTCGTSLKNIGYFTVNDKIYCDIHAKQVASIMGINYDFSIVNRNQQEVNSSLQQARQQQTANNNNNNQQQQQRRVPETINELSVAQQPTHFKSYASPSSPATISTMFADRSNSVLTSTDAASAGSGEVRWTWRPMTTRERSNTSAYTLNCQTTSAAPISMVASTSQQQEQLHYQQDRYNQQEQQRENLKQQQQQQQQQQSIGIRGRGLLQAEGSLIGGQIPICVHCNTQIHGPYILAGKTTWCKLCSQNHFNCNSCKRSLLNIGFIEDNYRKFYCEHCFEAYHAPICSKCNIRIKGDCLNALQKQWHPSCFVCGHCRRPFGNSSFYLEDNVPYCERDWNLLFTTKCYSCSYPIQAGDKWIEALERNYHSNCFRCSSCQANLEGSTFYCKNNKPYCRLHAR